MSRYSCWLCMNDHKDETLESPHECESEKDEPAPQGYELWKNHCMTVTPNHPGEKWFETTPLSDQYKAYLRGNPQFWRYMEAKYDSKSV